MSLLLDALKKAAEDKKKKSDADTPVTEDDMNLDLDIDESAEFPAVDETLPQKSLIEQREKDQKQAEQQPEPEQRPGQREEDRPIDKEEQKASDLDSNVDDREEQAQAEEKNIVETSGMERDNAGEPAPEKSEQRPNDDNVEPPQNKVSEKPEQELSLEQIITEDRSRQDKEVLSYLIHKSNQHSNRNKTRNKIMLSSLATLILLVLAIFAYLKLLSVSEQIYTGQSAPSIPESTQQPPRVAEVETVQTAPVEKPTVVKVAAEPDEPVPAAVEKPVPRQVSKVIPKKKPTEPEQPINIILKKQADPIDALLREAYRLFKAGDYNEAGKRYSEVISREQKNRDAQLGIAAIAMKQQKYEVARQRYMYLLRLNPKDSLARAGLSAIESHSDPLLSETRIKLMLREQPEAAHLYFALGNLYAAESRWGEAQSAFFSAWSADSENADYTYNLAVSLDHLGKIKQALDFYEKSLALNIGTHANFSAEAIEQRIKRLKGEHE